MEYTDEVGELYEEAECKMKNGVCWIKDFILF